ncbi:MAG: FG-GAP-like repeat-containing protein [Patescibacteria group bacterium]|nr:FG-GAP-like repeat-containing protein [Patescibacteria group bacterium]
MKPIYFEKDNQKSLKLLTKIKINLGLEVKTYQKIFQGTCYSVGVIAVISSVIFYVAGFVALPADTQNYIVSQSSNSVTLKWTAPGDDGAIGQATTYDIRYALSSITEENWDQATPINNSPQPSIAGTGENFTVSGLSANTLYYFAIKTADENNNWSGISNVASKKTASADLCQPDWSCTDWSECNDGYKSRTCIDKNNCTTNEDKPDERIVCSLPDEEEDIECIENWSCTAWSACLGGTQTRSCLDLNNCGTEKDKPDEIVECGMGGGLEETSNEHYLAVTPSAHGGPHLKLYDQNLNLYSQFFTYATSFRKGVTSALGDIDGDGQIEVITGTGPGSAPHVRIFDNRGNLEYQFYAYSSDFRVGLSVATADVNGNGINEIIVAPQEGGGPHVRIISYNREEDKFEVYKQFFAYPQNFRMGLNITGADLNNNGLAEIIVAPRTVGGPHIRIYEYSPIKRNFVMKKQFFAYAFGFRGGVSLATGDIDNDGLKEIITGAGPSGGPHIRIFDHQGHYKNDFFAASTRFRGGVDVTAMDYDLDGADEIITGTWSQGVPGVKVFDFENNAFTEEEFFYAYDPLYGHGIRVTGY